ncbi:porin family protein [Cytophaga aurantiaca]|uniref:porin family protein n=1 Tax=Cytophaga aurantiaca TaxID=29530 RepID=UPI0012FAB97A|nr:porin family protein [Cytophaga aurantiaca]
MNMLKQFPFIIFLLSASTSFAGEQDTSSFAAPASRYGIGNYRSLRAQKDDADLKHVEFGVRYMPTFSSMDFNTYDNGVVEGTVTMSQGFGVMVGLNFTKNIGVQGEINYYQANQQYKDRNFTNDVTVNYVNIPLLLSLNTNKAAMVNLNIVAGPQFGLNVGSKFSSSGNESSDTARATVALKKGDIGFAYGAGLEFALSKNHNIRLDVGYRGFFGLVDMDATTNDQGTYNVVVSASRKTYGGYAGLTFLF